MTPMTTLRHVVVRALADGLNEAGGIVVPEILYRDITFATRTADSIEPGKHTMAGIVLIGSDTLEPLARNIGRITLKILATEELLWLPLKSRRDFGAWTVEAVPLAAWMRLTTRSDESVLRAANINPNTGQPNAETEERNP